MPKKAIETIDLESCDDADPPILNNINQNTTSTLAGKKRLASSSRGQHILCENEKESSNQQLKFKLHQELMRAASGD